VHPVLVPLGDGFVVDFVSPGSNSACAVSIVGAMKCWGRGDAAQLGYNTTDNIGDWSPPDEMGDNLAIVDFGANFVVAEVLSGALFRCALSTYHRLKCFGYGAFGSLGNGLTTDVVGNSPNTPFVGFEDDSYVVALVSGKGAPRHACAWWNETLACWGDNEHGQLGLGDTVNRLSPARVLIQRNFISPPPTTIEPSAAPTLPPTILPTADTSAPTRLPTANPTTEPTAPTNQPTDGPTSEPSFGPTDMPSEEPTTEPSFEPTTEPTTLPTDGPSSEPTSDPTRGQRRPRTTQEESEENNSSASAIANIFFKTSVLCVVIAYFM